MPDASPDRHRTKGPDTHRTRRASQQCAWVAPQAARGCPTERASLPAIWSIDCDYYAEGKRVTGRGTLLFLLPHGQGRFGRLSRPLDLGFLNFLPPAGLAACVRSLWSRREPPSLLLQKNFFVEKRSDGRKRLQYCGRLSLKTVRGGREPFVHRLYTVSEGLRSRSCACIRKIRKIRLALPKLQRMTLSRYGIRPRLQSSADFGESRSIRIKSSNGTTNPFSRRRPSTAFTMGV